jgi:outer membrane biosynthesis protein TonB
VGAPVKRLALFISVALIASSSSALAATKKPTPTPTVKSTAKATAKPTVKATAKPTVKPTVKPTAKASAKPTVSASPAATTTAKATVKPKPKPKPKPKKTARKTPSPKPKWPPAGFAIESGVYAKVPSSKELIGILSARNVLASQVEACTKFVCGAVLVASEPGCRWWEVNSRVYGQDKSVIGSLQTISGESKPKEIKTILLISPEPLESLEYITGIEVVCHQEEKPSGYPSVTFTKAQS